MEYIVAQYRIRTIGRHSDIVACGVRGFAPFAVEAEPEAQATMELLSECNVEKSAFAELAELSSFGFEEDLAQCTLYRYEGGYLFEMVKDEFSYLFTKDDDSNIVKANYGTFESVDVTLLRFGLWLMFGLCIVPLGAIAIHSGARASMVVRCYAWVSPERARVHILVCGESILRVQHC